MSLAKRTHVLLEENQYKQLEQLAKQKKVSVGALIRDAIDKVYNIREEGKIKAVEKIIAMNLQVDDWELMEKEIIEGAVK